MAGQLRLCEAGDEVLNAWPGRTPRRSPPMTTLRPDGVINSWGDFSGNGQALADTAKAEETDRAPITIEVWKDGLVGAEIGATWYWTSGNPPGGTLSVVFLAAFVALELLLTWCRAHLRARSSPGSGIKAERRTLALADVSQVGVSAVGIWLLLSTYWWGGLFIVGIARLGPLHPVADQTEQSRELFRRPERLTLTV